MSVVNGKTKTDAGIRPACLQSTMIQSVCLGGRAWQMDRRLGGGQSLTRKKKSRRVRFFRSDRKYWSLLITTFVSTRLSGGPSPPSPFAPTKSPLLILSFFFFFFFSLRKPNHECFRPFIGWWSGEPRLIHPFG